MLTASVVMIGVISLGMLIGCTISKTNRPSDTSQPDKCDPTGPCNVGKPSQTHRELIDEIRASELTPDVKRRMLLELGVIDEDAR
jgi:hypothetical protein